MHQNHPWSPITSPVEKVRNFSNISGLIIDKKLNQLVTIPLKHAQQRPCDCECPKIPQRNFTLPENSCFQIDSRYRYQCIPGYVRKAGTSSLIKCVKEQVNSTPNWTASQLECIRKIFSSSLFKTNCIRLTSRVIVLG
uniref:Sushi domain-containing protein n=1 Tax=Fundulus heteroclitus TaxID=8078 RepID=A0A3Q2NNN8_FUNHE